MQMLLTVHDELVFEAPPELAEAVGAALKEEMESVYKLAVPLEVDIGIGDELGRRLIHFPPPNESCGR